MIGVLPGDLYVASTFFYQKLTAGGVERPGIEDCNAMRTIKKTHKTHDFLWLVKNHPVMVGLLWFNICHIAIQLDRIGQPGWNEPVFLMVSHSHTALVV